MKKIRPDSTITETLLDRIADPKLRRRDIAFTYSLALIKATDLTDWRAVNGAIITRWSVSALRWIKKHAWRQVNEIVIGDLRARARYNHRIATGEGTSIKCKNGKHDQCLFWTCACRCHEDRRCASGCRLKAALGDIYCVGCRSSINKEAE